MNAGARTTLLALSAALLGAACAFAIACGGDSGGSAADATATALAPATAPEEVLRLYVERRLTVGFVPDCDDAKRPDDIGKQCAKRVAERDGLLAYQLGPAFSEYTRLIILKPAGDTWAIEHLEERNPNEPPPPGVPWPIEVGATLIVAGTDPECLRLRDRPGLQGSELGCLDDGTAVTVVSGPTEVDNNEWWQLEDYGWASGTYLRYPDEAGVELTPTPEG